MVRNTRLQMLAVLAAGGVGGWLAATGRLPSLPQSIAAPPTTAIVAAASLAPARADEAIPFEVLVPADASLEINGYKTKETGEARHFQSPPVAPGGSYTYTAKAAARGKEVTKALHLAAGGANTFDLRPDLDAGAAAPERVQLESKPDAARKPNI